MSSDSTRELSPKKLLSILLLGGNPSDANLVKSKLDTENIDCELLRVETRADFVSALEKGGFALVLADFLLPQFEGRAVLEIFLERWPGLPFIFVSDASHERAVIELLQAGATDYVLKPDLMRLAPVIRRAAQEAQTRSELKRSKAALQVFHDLNLIISSIQDLASILRLLLDTIGILLPDAAAQVCLVDGPKGSVDLIVCRNLDEAQWKVQSESADRPIHKLIQLSKRPWTTYNLQEDARVSNNEFYRRQGVVSCLGVPLTLRGEVIGVLSWFTRQEHKFINEEFQFTETLAAQAGLAVEHFRLQSENHRLFDDLSSKEKHIGKLLIGLMNAQDEEARRITRVLHDESAQLLASVHTNLGVTAKKLPEASRAEFQNITRSLDEVEKRLRDLSHELYPPTLEALGLVPSLEDLAAYISKRKGLKITVKSNLNVRLPPLLELTIYRVVQEALNNTARHAKASRVRVQLLEKSASIFCSVRDNGTGFDVEAKTRAVAPTLGLASIHERIDALDGTLQIKSAPGSGTELLVRLPLSLYSRNNEAGKQFSFHNSIMSSRLGKVP